MVDLHRFSACTGTRYVRENPYLSTSFQFRVLCRRCDAYIDNIIRRWRYILGPSLSHSVVDHETVRHLELLAPKHSLCDHDTICWLIEGGQVFSGVTDAKERQAIKERLRHCDRVITIRSFFDDMIYSRACFEALRTLLPPHSRCDARLRLRDAFRRAFGGDPSTFWRSYVSLWLWVFRNFPGLPSGKNGGLRVCRRNRGRVAQDFASRAELAYVARSFGFENETIGGLTANLTANPRLENVPFGMPTLSSHRRNVCEHARSNRPCQTTYPLVASGLYPSHVFKPIDEPPGAFVTPFALTRDLMMCFWGEEYDRQKYDAALPGDAARDEVFWTWDEASADIQTMTMTQPPPCPIDIAKTQDTPGWDGRGVIIRGSEAASSHGLRRELSMSSSSESFTTCTDGF